MCLAFLHQPTILLLVLQLHFFFPDICTLILFIGCIYIFCMYYYILLFYLPMVFLPYFFLFFLNGSAIHSSQK